MKTSRHHRLPRQIGGSDNGSNISIVPDMKHKSWHCCFGTLNPFEIAKIINKEFLARTTYVVRVHTDCSFHGRGHPGCKDKQARRRHWFRFCRDHEDIWDVCNEMNDKWLPRGVFMVPINFRVKSGG